MSVREQKKPFRKPGLGCLGSTSKNCEKPWSLLGKKGRPAVFSTLLCSVLCLAQFTSRCYFRLDLKKESLTIQVQKSLMARNTFSFLMWLMAHLTSQVLNSTSVESSYLNHYIHFITKLIILSWQLFVFPENQNLLDSCFWWTPPLFEEDWNLLPI